MKQLTPCWRGKPFRVYNENPESRTHKLLSQKKSLHHFPNHKGKNETIKTVDTVQIRSKPSTYYSPFIKQST